MFNKEARLMKSYIKKKGTKTVTKTATLEQNLNGIFYSSYDIITLPANTKITSIYLGRISGSVSGSYGEGDYSSGINYLNIGLYNTKMSNPVWSINSSKGKRTYTPNVAALYFYAGVEQDNSVGNLNWSSSVKITYEYTTEEEYDYVVKY